MLDEAKPLYKQNLTFSRVRSKKDNEVTMAMDRVLDLLREDQWDTPALEQIAPKSRAVLLLLALKEQWQRVHIDWAKARNVLFAVDVVRISCLIPP